MMPHKFLLRAILGSIALVALTGHLRAASPVLSAMTPQGAQRGTEIEVVFAGQRLGDGPHQLLFYEPGIEVGEIAKVDGNQVKCKLKLAPECRMGRHAVRVRTASGISNLMTFHVGNLKEITETEPNNTVDGPQEIALGVVINGVITEGDSDYFVVQLEANQRLSVEIEGLRMGRTMFDPKIELLTPDGNLLATSDDQTAAHHDAFVSLRQEAAGKVLIRVREVAYRGNGSSNYRLHVGQFPRPTAVFPLAAVPGKPAELQWADGTKQTVEVPATEKSIHQVHASDEQGISPSSLPLYLSEHAPHLEVEPNDRREEATEITAPGVASGVISQAGDKDFYRFKMKKGQEWDFRVRARELRSPLDAVLHVFDTKGKYVKGNDDDAGQPDSYLRFKAPADGEYQLDVEDRMLRGNGSMGYVLEISQPAPIAELKLDERQRYVSQVINIPQGGRTAAMMTVRRVNLGGPLQVEWNNLPEGTKAEAVPLAANYNRVPVLFTAESDAKLNASLAQVSARLTEKPQPIESPFRQQTWLIRGRNNTPVWNHYAERATVAVTQALPYSVRVIEPKAPLVQNGSMELKVVAERAEGFENSIAIRTLYNPPGVSTNQSRSITKGKTEALIPITANGGARTGKWKIVLLGRTSINGAVEASTQLATIEIVQAYFDLKIPTLTAVQGNTAELAVSLEHRTPFEGEAELQLIRLPPGVTAEKVKIKAGDETAQFQLKLAKDARVGRHRGVGCTVVLTVAGEPVRYSQGYVDLHVDPAPSAAPAAVAENKSQKGKAS